jgi:hypothetical protein
MPEGFHDASTQPNVSQCKFLYHLLKVMEQRRKKFVNSAEIHASIEEDADPENALPSTMVGKMANELERKTGRGAKTHYVTSGKGKKGWTVEEGDYVTSSLAAALVIAVRDSKGDRLGLSIPRQTVEASFQDSDPVVIKGKIDWLIESHYLKRSERNADYIGLEARAHDDMGFIEPLARLRLRSSGPAVEAPARDARQDEKKRQPLPGDLRDFVGELHLYHLSESKLRVPTWWYKPVKFEPLSGVAKLVGRASNLPEPTAPKARHEYDYELTKEKGGHLVLWARRLGTFDDDFSVSLFPKPSEEFPHAGLTLGSRTWANRPNSSVCILADKKLDFATNLVDGAPVDDPEISRRLEILWNETAQQAHIVRLPLIPSTPPSPTATEAVTIQPKWDEDQIRQLVTNAPPDGEIRIFVSFFVTDADLFEFFKEVLLSSKRTISILMLDPDPELPVLTVRYGTDEEPIRETLTAQDARREIIDQLGRLAKIQKVLNQDAGRLNVRVYGCAPTLVSYYSSDEMLVGTLLLHASANTGPMIRVQRSAPMWSMIEENWKAVTRISKLPKQQ